MSIFIIWLMDNVWILQGEVTCQSLLRVTMACPSIWNFYSSVRMAKQTVWMANQTVQIIYSPVRTVCASVWNFYSSVRTADQTFQTIYSSIRTVRQTVWMLQGQFVNRSLLLANESIKAQFRHYASLTPNLIQP